MSGQAVFDKLVRPAAMCRDGAAEKKEVEQCEEIELNGVGEERDDISDEEGDKIDDEEELAAQDWPDTKGERRARSNTRAVPRLVRTLHARRLTIAMDYFFLKKESAPRAQSVS